MVDPGHLAEWSIMPEPAKILVAAGVAGDLAAALAASHLDRVYAALRVGAHGFSSSGCEIEWGIIEWKGEKEKPEVAARRLPASVRHSDL
jgi:hypothetical protein